MKKSLLLLLCLLLTLPFLCAAEEATEATLVPAMPVFDWERNVTEHWRVLENGVIADASAHTLGDDLLCAVCGSEVWAFDDLSASIFNYDAYGNDIRYTSFDCNGVADYESVKALTYDDDGNVIHAFEFIDGVLFSESTFTINAEGEHVPVAMYAWYDDGTWSTNEYDEYGNCVRSVSYDVDHSILSEIISEYTRDSWGWFYESKTTTYMGESSFMSEYNEYGDRIRVLNIDKGVAWADETYEYLYEDGQKRWCKTFSQERLINECFYSPEDAMIVKEIEYQEDGTMIVYAYDSNGDQETVTFLLADGTVDMVQTYEHHYDEDGTLSYERVSIDGVLVLHTEYGLTADGWYYTVSETLYNADGSYLVCTYDENEELVSEINYDAQGHVIE